MPDPEIAVEIGIAVRELALGRVRTERVHLGGVELGQLASRPVG